MMQRNYRNPRHTVITVLTILGMLCACLLAGCSSNSLEDGIIMDNVKVAGINLGGMTKEEAISALRLSVSDHYATNPMVLVLGEQQVELPAELTKVTLNAEAAVEEAYNQGRIGSRSEKKEQQLLASTTGIQLDIAPYMTIDQEAIVAHLEELHLTPGSEVIPTTWEVVGDAPDLSAEVLPEELQKLVFHMGTPSYTYDLELMLKELLRAYHSNTLMIEFPAEANEPEAVDLDAIFTEHHKDPSDASVDPESYEVIPHSYGYSFDLEAAKAALAAAQFGADVEIPFVATAPQQTTEGLGSMLFRDVLSSHSAYSSSSANRATNLRLACEAIDGTVVMPGEVFDYNETTGQRTTEKGYKAASGYAGGKTVDMIGGGVCQPSSIIYYCALLADLEITTRVPHQFISSYMDPGMDATVSWGGPHFRFTNNTEYPIRIDAEADGGTVSIKLVGTDTKDHYVKMEYQIIDKWGWTTEYEEYTPEQAKAKGYTDGKVLSTPYNGYLVDTYRCRYSKADDSLIERVFEARSEYDSRDKLVVKIVEDEEETQPTEPETKPTTTPTTAPTTAPTTQPTEAPTAPPTEAPTAPPTEAPTAPPTEAPTEPPAPVTPPEGGESSSSEG